jgi:hypothetical protein
MLGGGLKQLIDALERRPGAGGYGKVWNYVEAGSEASGGSGRSANAAARAASSRSRERW